MNAIQSRPVPAHLKTIFTLARLLQRLEQSEVPVGPDQYRAVADKLAGELKDTRMDSMLEALLGAHPAAAELYENLNYQHAGLCRSPLEASLDAELEARKLLARAASPRADTSRL